MALKLSTAAVNWLTNGVSLRELISNMCMRIYSSSAPTYADDAVVGTLLCEVTRASGALTAATLIGLPQTGKVVFSEHDDTETYIINVTVDGVGPTSYTFALGTYSGGLHSLPDLCNYFAAWLMQQVPQLIAISDGATTVWVSSRIPEMEFTIADGGGTGAGDTYTNEVIAHSHVNTLRFGAPAIGVISKVVGDTWSGVNLATGVAGYFRLVRWGDPGTLDSSYLWPRIQGTIAPSGSDMDMPNTTLSVGVTLTLTSGSFTLPKVAS
jgi:hypothetical protein